MSKIVAYCGESSLTHLVGTWLVDQGKVIRISQDDKHPTDLPPGTYELHWDFRGNPGDVATIELYEYVSQKKWVKYKGKVEVRMPGGFTIMTSDVNPPTSYKPYLFVSS